jgi:hypothetical protein
MRRDVSMPRSDDERKVEGELFVKCPPFMERETNVGWMF